jgi:tetratricopeptide (TPR) repeat protein
VHASLLADLGKTDQAVVEMKKLLNGKQGPDREAYLEIAQIYEKGKNYREEAKALDAAEKLSESNEEKEAVLFQRGAMFEREKNVAAAEAEFRKVLEINPKNAGALNYLGYMLADNNLKLQEARDLIQKALDEEPNNGAYLDSLGWVYFKLNQYPQAEEQLVKALESASMAKDPTVHEHLGEVYFQQGKIRDAISQWQTSLNAWQSSAPSDQDQTEISKVQKKLEDAKVRLARENGGK